MSNDDPHACMFCHAPLGYHNSGCVLAPVDAMSLARRRAWAEAGCAIPPPPTVTIRGRVRLYFNRHQDAPRVWCLSDMDRNWEIHLAHVVIQAPLETVYEPLVPTTDNHDGPPTAYQVSTCEVLVVVTGDRAVINPAPDTETRHE